MQREHAEPEQRLTETNASSSINGTAASSPCLSAAGSVCVFRHLVTSYFVTLVTTLNSRSTIGASAVTTRRR